MNYVYIHVSIMALLSSLGDRIFVWNTLYLYSTSAEKIRSQVSAAFSSEFTDTSGVTSELQNREGSYIMNAIASGLHGGSLVGVRVSCLAEEHIHM